MLYFQSLFALGNAAAAPAVRLKISKFWESVNLTNVRSVYTVLCSRSFSEPLLRGVCGLCHQLLLARRPGVFPARFLQQLSVSPNLLSPLWSTVQSVTMEGFRWAPLCCIVYTIRSDTVVIAMLSHPCQESLTLRISHRKFRSTRTNQ